MKITRLLAPLLVCASISARAQFALVPLVGPNMSYASSVNIRYKGNLGIKAGALCEYDISKGASLRSGILYSSYKLLGWAFAPFRINAFEIPLTILTKLGDPEGSRVILGIGPYLGIQPDRTITDAAGNKTNQSVGSYIKPAYIGLTVEAGYEFESGFYTRVSCQPGIADLSAQKLANYYITQVNVSFGFRLPFASDKKDTAPIKEQ